MINFAIDRAYICAGLLEGALWGLYSGVFAYFMYTFLSKDSNSARDRWTYTNIAAILMYILATTHFGIEFQRLLEGFVEFRDTISPKIYFSQLGGANVPLTQAQVVVYVLTSVIGNSVLAWRCHVVWGKKFFWVTAIPCILITLDLVGGMIGVNQALSTSPDFNLAIVMANMLLFCGFFSNLSATLLLVGRIWWLSSRNLTAHNSGSNKFKPLMILMLESGFFIFAFKITEFILFQITPLTGEEPGNNALYIVFDSVPQIIGMMPTIIIILVDAGYTTVDTRRSTAVPSRPMLFKTKETSSSKVPPTSYPMTSFTNTNSDEIATWDTKTGAYLQSKQSETTLNQGVKSIQA